MSTTVGHREAAMTNQPQTPFGREAWHHFYTGAYWQRRRRQQLLAHPLCKFCGERGQVVRATVVDHVKPHRGDWNLFVLGALQSLCAPCHNSIKQKLEQERPGVDADGWPLDRRN
jgi:5-methylcytosine-specific restriction endonuclease McrA